MKSSSPVDQQNGQSQCWPIFGGSTVYSIVLCKKLFIIKPVCISVVSLVVKMMIRAKVTAVGCLPIVATASNCDCVWSPKLHIRDPDSGEFTLYLGVVLLVFSVAISFLR